MSKHKDCGNPACKCTKRSVFTYRGWVMKEENPQPKKVVNKPDEAKEIRKRMLRYFKDING